jgi:hypothetical protein
LNFENVPVKDRELMDSSVISPPNGATKQGESLEYSMISPKKDKTSSSTHVQNIKDL